LISLGRGHIFDL